MAGGRSGRFATFGNTPMFSVDVAIAVSSVQASRKAGWYGWSCTLTQSRPAASARRASSMRARPRVRLRSHEYPERKVVTVVSHRDLPG